MLRFAFSVLRAVPLCITKYPKAATSIGPNTRSFTALNLKNNIITGPKINENYLNKKYILDICNNINPTPVRSVTKFSLKRGKRKTVKAAVRRFFRLHWGGWIRPKVGRNKKLWKKSEAQKRRLRQHVFCNSTQSTMLDKMVTKFWKKPKHYVDDPYAPYHTREEFFITRKKPLLKN